ncbi:MAG: hypothetical protein DHS20C13_25230 [Thermodesulfobacteriota bacterium]|nr:MAG: hypothetical protein DHS20C13_25230 [Thermodesulfobacteriota bacterium]GJM36330.1 MAG: hypothetical protein DHS20C18_53310 [Saprospiraceae bacterium]
MPIVNSISYIAEIAYELDETYAKKDLEVKKKTTNNTLAEEDHKHSCPISNSKFYTKFNCVLFTSQKDHLNSHLDNPFPPPEWC